MNHYNISALDHRYSSIVEPIAQIFCPYSYYGEIYDVEVKYLEFFCKNFENADCKDAISSLKKYDMEVFNLIMEEEKKTFHDIKSVINVIQKQLIDNGHSRASHFVHFGLTSQDIVSVVNNILISRALECVHLSTQSLMSDMGKLLPYSNLWCLSRTHGQPATPHKFITDIERWIENVEKLSELCNSYKYCMNVKFGGSVGGFVALRKLYPSIDVENTMREFLRSLDLSTRSTLTNTTQTDKWDYFTTFCTLASKFISLIISDCQEIWHLTSIGYLKLSVPETYCGSSAMPHKINPIKFENAEGCLQRCEKDFQFYTEKLSKSRLHRDLSDSVVVRMIPETIGYLYVAINSLRGGFQQMSVNIEAIDDDLDINYQANSEIVQLYLKMKGDDDAYERSKFEFRQGSMTRHDFLFALQHLGIDWKDIKDFFVGV